MPARPNARPRHPTDRFAAARLLYLACMLAAVALLPAAPARAESFTVTARVLCPASLNGGVLDSGFTVAPTFVPCAGIRVSAMDSDPLWDDYCGAAYTDSQGRVRFAASCGDAFGGPPGIYLKIEGRSALGFSVGTHDYTFWDALVDVFSLGLSLGATLPFEAVDYLTKHATFAWITGGERAGTNGATLDFGDVCIGAAAQTQHACQLRTLDRDSPVSIFAARQFWAAQYAMQVLRSVTTRLPMDFNYTVDAPLGQPMTVWDTVVVDGDAAISRPADMLTATAHEIGHVVYNTYHSDNPHWLTDVTDYMTHHSYCEGGHFMTLAWYEGFANWVRHVAFGRTVWLTNRVTLPPGTGPCASGTGFDREGNVTAVLDALYFGPLDSRAPLAAAQFSCPAGFTRLQDATGVVRCRRTTAPSCAAGRTLDASGICARPGVEPVTAALYRQLMAACASRRDRDTVPCPAEPIEVAQPGACPPGAARVQVSGGVRCVQDTSATSAFPGPAPLPRGDGTPNSILAATPGGGQRWFRLADADTLIGFVAAAGLRAHRMEEFWTGWIRPWCVANEPDGAIRFCNPAQSPDFVRLVPPAAPSFP